MAYVTDPGMDVKVARALRRGRKSLVLAYLFWLFCGGLGVHRFYLGAWVTGAAQAVLVLLGLALVLEGVGLPMLMAWLVWLLIDAFYIPALARKRVWV
ncbi:TM2 domain-containing protein [Oceanicola sp. D3]|uniref:NINE protein n=1 Tax=Oceanicola sp. D3 TaxID=2587163 RepID=UPI00111F6AD4|nr:TM2 domain-containing protein [Oceanicola sp. D3]QDC09447.1 TM2 domain-containing protein [Oceanicola sp. D3]